MAGTVQMLSAMTPLQYHHPVCYVKLLDHFCLLWDLRTYFVSYCPRYHSLCSQYTDVHAWPSGLISHRLHNSLDHASIPTQAKVPTQDVHCQAKQSVC